MAAKFVKAVHKLTGFVQEVPESYLDLFEAFERADESKIEAARKQQEIDLYGEELGDRRISDVLLDRPDETWRKDDIVAYAEGHGVAVDSTKTKAEILETIHAQEGVN